MKHSKLAAVILVALVVVTALAALAQEEVADYVVRSSSAANARSCPRLDCAVVTTFPPGEIISVVDTVSGDTVSGSDQWHRVVHDGANVYVHNSLVAVHASDKGAPALTASVTDQWVEHSAAGVSIKTPRTWLDTSEDKTSLVLSDPLTGSWINIYVEYTGMEERLASMRRDLEAEVEFPGSTVLASEITDIPAGETIHIQYQWESEGDPVLTYTSDYYTLVANRTTYTIYLSADSRVSEGVTPIFEAMIGTFAIDSPEAARTVAADLAGAARLGDNTGELLPDSFQLWTYEGQAGEALTISAIADRPLPVGPDTRLVVRAPDGEVLAENDDGGFLGGDLNASISGLELPQAGTYEIEVHGYYGFTLGDYTLVMASSLAPQTITVDNLTFTLPGGLVETHEDDYEYPVYCYTFGVECLFVAARSDLPSGLYFEVLRFSDFSSGESTLEEIDERAWTVVQQQMFTRVELVSREELEVGGWRGIQRIFTAGSQTHLMLFIQDGEAFVRLRAWGASDSFEEYRDDLDATVRSLRFAGLRADTAGVLTPGTFSGGSFTLTYPDDWSATTDFDNPEFCRQLSNGCLFVAWPLDSYDQFYVELYRDSEAGTLLMSAERYDWQVWTGIQAETRALRLDSRRELQVDGRDAVQRIFTYVNENGERRTALLLTVKDQGSFLVVWAEGDPDTFRDYRDDLDAIIDRIRFVESGG